MLEPSRRIDDDVTAALRSLPSVDELARRLGGDRSALAVWAARRTIAAARERALGGVLASDLELDARGWLERAFATAPRRVLNATGVIVHTNLGRAPLPDGAVRAVAQVAAGYSDLEYDLERGERGSRQDHVAGLLCELTGAEDALVVNNCAGAVLLTAAALSAGRELVVSRGQLVEIGGSFRIPDVVEQSGATLVEVGTTNRARTADYEAAVGPETGAILCVHPSNFRVVGFSEEVPIETLCGLGPPVVHDVGSGVLAESMPHLDDEPSVKRSIEAGCAVVCFSGDKLLGGPQAGIMAGERSAIERCRKHPLARALRIGKLPLAGLVATLALYRDPALAAAELPVLRMLDADPAELAARAESMRGLIVAGGGDAHITEAVAKVGGGALPLLELPGPACAVAPGDQGLETFAARLRSSRPSVVARVVTGRLLLDPRTLSDVEAEEVGTAVVASLT